MDAVAETVQQLIEGMRQRSALCSEDSLEELSTAFMNSSLSAEAMEPTEYLKWLRCNVLEREVIIESPMMMGHMTTKLPSYMPDVGKLVTAMNLNLVKTETAKVTSLLEREAIAVLHKEIFHQDDAFYARHVQCRSSSLGVMTSGGTAANIQALWMARQRLCPDAEARGLTLTGARRAVVLTSALAHYSVEKAMCLLGLGSENLIKVQTLSDFSVDVKAMKRVLQRLENVQVMAIVGLAGATETGHVDDLEALADLAASLGAHFHVDAAWGFPLLLSDHGRGLMKGAERADTVAVDGHKLLYTPMGCGTLLMRDPLDPSRVCKSARYIIREDSFDQGRFTLEGSRPAMAIYLHVNLRCLGRQGLLSRIAAGCALAQRLAEMLRRDESSFELITDPPQSNIVLYRYIPRSFRHLGSVLEEHGKALDHFQVALQSAQAAAGRSFVSRTAVPVRRYGGNFVVCLRAVFGNPSINEEHLEQMLQDQERHASELEKFLFSTAIDIAPSPGGTTRVPDAGEAGEESSD